MRPALCLRRLAWCLGAAALVGGAHAAETFPARPITWLVGFAPGGSVDVVTRAIAQQASVNLKQTIVVENKPGGAGSIAMSTAARAPADGYTLVTLAGPILHPGSVPAVGKELTGVATMAEGAVVLVGSPGGPATATALLEAIRREPTRFAFASSGMGTNQHLAGEMLNLALKVNMVHVPYKGGSQAVTDIIGGQVQLGFLGVSTVLEHVRNGRLIAYAVGSPERIAALPQVPTLREAGVEGFSATQWYAAAAPAGLPETARQTLRDAIEAAVRSPQVASVLESAGLNPPASTDTDPTALVVDSLAQARKVAQQAGIVLD